MNTLESTFDNRSVGEIVSLNYHAAGIFREYGIDFCCGGGQSLAEACAKKGVETAIVAEKLTQLPWQTTSSGENYREWTPDLLINYIEQTHHRFVRSKTEEIAAYARKVAGVHGERHPENVEIYHKFVSLGHELLNHLEAEENTVFPLIKKVAELRKSCQDVDQDLMDELRRQLDLMEDDHEGAGKLIAEIRELSNDFTPPAEACTTYRILYQNLAGFEEDLHKHVHLENNILFRKAQALL